MPLDSPLVDLLNEREGEQTTVLLRDGRQLDVRNIAWGYDQGDETAHVTTNCSPFVDGLPLVVFFTSDVQSVSDEAGAVIYGEHL